ncbi:MAG TPA: sialate O-acetylesterase [Candidatus Acidoferrales bacterium]|nr:sialate O-acetylesterase [Candidatus Acidoferrales bacterium]
MVLQQGVSVPIWGWGRDGDTVTVQFQQQSVSATVKNGQWAVQLAALKPGGPDTMTISGGSGKPVRLKNVLVGEVWLASGQSNMEFPLRRSFEGEAALAKCANPLIHLLKVPHARLDSPTNDIGASWTECNSNTAANFSAVEYYFARDLQKALNVPVGVIESDWGGTPIEAWIEPEFLRAIPDYRAPVFDEWAIAQDHYERSLDEYRKKKAAAQASGAEFTNAAPRLPWKPGTLYNGMIAPLVGYAMKGALWYQGESNANSENDAWLYHLLLPDLIRNWRDLWGKDPFPFLLVQLAPYGSIQPEPTNSAWASVREAQLQATKTLPNVGLAVITDVGEQHNIHPTHKEPVGERLAIAARGIAYHQPIEYSGPVLKEVRIDDEQIVLTFDHVDGGLESQGAHLLGFAIAGDDGKFVWADADIKGLNQVLVYSSLVRHPVAVRYGWANYPVVNLWNKAGLPASPFRTDDFELR